MGAARNGSMGTAGPPTNMITSRCEDPHLQNNLRVLESLTAISGILLLCLVLLGTHRRRCSPDHFLHFVVRNAPAVSKSVIAWTAGMMFSTVIYNDFLVFWVLFLLILVSNADTISATNLQDVGKTGHEFGVYYFLPFFYAGYVLGMYPVHDRLKYTCCILFVAAFFKLNELLNAHLNANKSCGLGEQSKIISDYMASEHERSSLDDVQPHSLQGYKYIFSDEKRGCPFEKPPLYVKEFEHFDRVITIDGVWREARFLNDELRDVFLSYSMFNLIKRTVAEYPMREHDQTKTWRLVGEGLLSKAEDGSEDNTRAFRVVEVELGFLFDFFFTKYFFLCMDASLFTYRKIFFAVLVIVSCALSLPWVGNHKLGRGYCYHFDRKGVNVDAQVTRGILALIVLVEAIQLFKMLASNWFKVHLVTRYMRIINTMRSTSSPTECSPCRNRIKKAVDAIGLRFIPAVLLAAWKIDQFMPAFFRKAWSRKIHEYNFLESYIYRPGLLKRVYYMVTDTLLEKPRPGQKKGSFTPFTGDIHKAVLDSLRTNWPNLRNGKSSLRRNDVDGLLSDWSCTEVQDTCIQILVWHVATTLCEPPPPPPPDSLLKLFISLLPPRCFTQICSHRRSRTAITGRVDYQLIATQLSKYCAYLVAFAPELLPGNTHMTRSIFSQAVSEAIEILKGSNTPADRIERVRCLSANNPDNHEKTILYLGSKLADTLLHRIEDDGFRWKVIADFWAEMIVFVSPSDRPSVHVERLTQGGELITQIWALLYHAGVSDRNSGKLQA